MNKQEYSAEIKLILEQNNTEVELYPLISEIIEPSLNGLSRRYVFARRRSTLGQIFYGISSFPDIAILDHDFNKDKNKEINVKNWKKLRGCVEAKAYGQKLYDLDELRELIFNQGKNLNRNAAQLIGEILWYKKVLYTNGVCWKLFRFDAYSNFENEIIGIAKERIKNKAQSDWWEIKEIKNFIENIFDKNKKYITENFTVENCKENWEDLIANIEKIGWDSKTQLPVC